MQENKMKNIVVLKNLPSNLIDEAILILKNNKNAVRLQHIESVKKLDKLNSGDNLNDLDSNEYVIKEAESIISSYISKLENVKKGKSRVSNMHKKYGRLKKYSIFVSIILIVSFIKIIILS